MNAPLEEIEFLTRSNHRVDVLDALVGQPRDRNDLHAATGASSPTMGRILGASKIDAGSSETGEHTN